MAFRLPAILSAKKIPCWSLSSGKEGTSRYASMPKGYVAVYVGEEQKKRFVVPLSYLSEIALQDLLDKAEEEFGFDHPMGGLTILCREDIFIDITSQFQIWIPGTEKTRFMISHEGTPTLAEALCCKSISIAA